jgi:hypothetical protein
MNSRMLYFVAADILNDLFLPNLLLFLCVFKYYFIPIKKMGYDFTNVPGQESSKFFIFYLFLRRRKE